MLLRISLLFSCLLFACSPERSAENKDTIDNNNQIAPGESNDTSYTAETDGTDIKESDNYQDMPDTAFISMNQYSQDFLYEMKYATDDNFLKKKVYKCSECLLRKEVADAIIKANDSLNSLGYQIKFFDCYRPVDVQKQMWEIYPDARYVANPNTTGSIHNRGGAVDITLADINGNELNMGTGFDHFGKEAHHSYLELPDTVIANRRLLKNIMEAYGFNAISTEWWHYNFRNSRKYNLSNFKVECED